MLNLLLNVLSSVLGNRLDALMMWLYRHGLPMSKHRYFNQLRSLLASMPFIYQDLKLEVLSDFVDADVQTVDPQTLKERPNRTFLEKTATARLVDHRRALLFGDGGMGKTTFFRYVTLAALDRKHALKIFNQQEHVLPIFIPLKALDNSKPFPIAEALLRDCEYFLGAWGKRRLFRLARSRKLLLLFDGFDEIPHFPNNGALADELCAIFGPLDLPIPARVEASEHRELYGELRFCRAYLSSRRDYFLAQPLTLANDVPRWLLRGLSDTRARLVGNIFRHYIQRNKAFYSPMLNHELFISELEASSDEGFVELSRNPLFLTVIVFVYVSEITQGKNRGDLFKRSSSELIAQCTHLLIYGIDEAKTVGMSKIQAEALLARRTNDPEDKMKFLRYLAGKVSLAKISVFSEDDLMKWAVEYFKRDGSKNAAILSRLQRNLETGNIVLELLQSGIFVKVAMVGGVARYDFPHRRFRECLSEELVLDMMNTSQMSEIFRDASIHDLIVGAAKASQATWQDVSEAVWLSIKRNPSDGVQWKLFNRLLGVAPRPGLVAALVRNVVVYVGGVEFNSELPNAFLDSIHVSKDLAVYLVDRLNQSLVANNARGVAIYAALLNKSNHHSSIDEIAKTLALGAGGDLISWLNLLPYVSGVELGQLGASIVERFGVSSTEPSALVGVCVFGFSSRAERDKAQLRSTLLDVATRLAPWVASEFEAGRFDEWLGPFLNGVTFDTKGVRLPFSRHNAPISPRIWLD
jgi:hypothetical protein